MPTQETFGQAPLARTENLQIKELGDEIVVYDRKTDEAHCLGPVAARVWRSCDGERSLAELGDPAETAAALVELADKGLLVEHAPAEASGMSRRGFVGRMAVAAAAAPLIVSVAAPTAQAAVSCVNPGGLPPGASCTNNGACCSNICDQDPNNPGKICS